MDLLAALRTFSRVVETGSFTAVAAELNTTQPTVSRQVAALEDHLGARLLSRTTRQLNLTDDGRVLYEHARRLLEAAEEARGAVGRRKGRPAGLLRLATPVVFGRLHVLPRLPGFLARHPEVSLDLVMSDSFTDLVEEGIDLAIRVGEVTDPALIAKRIGTTRRVTVASPEYLARRGEPAAPGDLGAHDCIVYTRLATGPRWTFSSADGPVTVEVSGRLRVNNSEGVREAVLGGLGIGVVPLWLVSDEVERGLVRLLMRPFEPQPLPMHAVYPSRRFLALKVRAMIDFLETEFALDPVISPYGT
jgi:DNA-binding transcriptional LysR family regulator